MEIPAGRTLDTVTGEEWRQATHAEQQAFLAAERLLGGVAFRCLTCGYPVSYGGAPCPACEGAVC